MPPTHPRSRRPDVSRPGLLITMEGVDGAGKTTQCGLLVDALRASGRRAVLLREPGGTRLSESIRGLLLDPTSLDEGASMSPVAELLLYEASRAQLVSQVIVPELARGTVVVCDRFYDSTYAYQGFARGLGAETVDGLNRLACGDVAPDRTLVLDTDPTVSLRRAVAHGADRMEAEGGGLQRLVRQGLLDAARREPGRVHVVDAVGGVEQVFARVLADLADLVALPAPGAPEATAVPRAEGGAR